MHADTDREALYLSDHPLQYASEKSCLSAAQRQTGGLSGGVKDGGERRCGKAVSGAEFSRTVIISHCWYLTPARERL